MNWTASGDPSNDNGCIVLRNALGEVFFGLTTVSTTDENLYSDRVLTEGRWYHIVASRAGTSQTLYIDGDLEGVFHRLHIKAPDAACGGRRHKPASLLAARDDQYLDMIEHLVQAAGLELHRRLAEAALIAGDSSEAQAQGDRSLRLAQELEIGLEQGCTHRVLGEIALAQGQLERAEQHLLSVQQELTALKTDLQRLEADLEEEQQRIQDLAQKSVDALEQRFAEEDPGILHGEEDERQSDEAPAHDKVIIPDRIVIQGINRASQTHQHTRNHHAQVAGSGDINPGHFRTA